MLPALADEKKRVVEDVAKDRQHAIDAAIVRTMKSRKVMNHQQVRGSRLPRHCLIWPRRPGGLQGKHSKLITGVVS